MHLDIGGKGKARVVEPVVVVVLFQVTEHEYGEGVEEVGISQSCPVTNSTPHFVTSFLEEGTLVTALKRVDRIEVEYLTPCQVRVPGLTTNIQSKSVLFT